MRGFEVNKRAKAHYELGVAQYETGDLKSAAAHFEIVAMRAPQWVDARYSLGSVLARIDRLADAVRELSAALSPGSGSRPASAAARLPAAPASLPKG